MAIQYRFDKASGPKHGSIVFLNHFASSPRVVFKHLLPNSLPTASGNHIATSLFSFPNKNLFPSGPQKIAVGWPSNDVLKTKGLPYLSTLSLTNLSGVPLVCERMNSSVSPKNGHPKLPGGRLLLVASFFLWVWRKKHKTMNKKKSASNVVAIGDC
ncbi:hypothetical protein HanPI659440_Chr10g0380361 [Helianthus annuus]|nr:hypothetical protein HanPI659440_Chr10g0380361 [Helianthus annuus]